MTCMQASSDLPTSLFSDTVAFFAVNIDPPLKKRVRVKIKEDMEALKVAQKATAAATKPDKLNSIFGFYLMKDENILPQLSPDPHRCTHRNR